jgi:hypothetical protein
MIVYVRGRLTNQSSRQRGMGRYRAIIASRAALRLIEALGSV